MNRRKLIRKKGRENPFYTNKGFDPGRQDTYSLSPGAPLALWLWSQDKKQVPAFVAHRLTPERVKDVNDHLSLFHENPNTVRIFFVIYTEAGIRLKTPENGPLEDLRKEIHDAIFMKILEEESHNSRLWPMKPRH